MDKYIYCPYFQYLCEEIYFQYEYPFDPSDFVNFRKRIGEGRMKKIFKHIIEMFGKDQERKEVREIRVDTMVQEKNITFHTDRKLVEEVIYIKDATNKVYSIHETEVPCISKGKEQK